jgi:hypothetical protein
MSSKPDLPVLDKAGETLDKEARRKMGKLCSKENEKTRMQVGRQNAVGK